jgi:hypothetical protein
VTEVIPSSSTAQIVVYSAQYSLKVMSSLQARAGEHACQHPSLAPMQVVDRSAGAGPSGDPPPLPLPLPAPLPPLPPPGVGDGVRGAQ